MTKLIILDYIKNKVHIFNVDGQPTEETVESLGFSISNCSWMEGDLDIFYHKGVLICE